MNRKLGENGENGEKWGEGEEKRGMEPGGWGKGEGRGLIT